jgi:molybdopterin converting factor subunit 1
MAGTSPAMTERQQAASMQTAVGKGDMTKPLTILYFAWLRERTGAAQEELKLPDGVTTIADLVDLLAARSPGHAAAFQNRRTVRCALNHEFADPSATLRPGDEVAFFPPVTGG